MNFHRLSFLILSASAFLLNGCSSKEQSPAEVKIGPDPLITNRDTTISPGKDFFYYANGGWINKHPIPESENSNGIFRTIQDTINDQVKRICEKSAADKQATPGSNKQKIGDYFASGMDTVAIEKAGLKDFKPTLDAIDKIKTKEELPAQIANLQKSGVDAAYSFWVSQDDKISTKYALFFWQGGLGLGERDYYFDTDARSKEIRAEYLNHLSKTFSLLGDNEADAKKKSIAVMNLETQLAKSSRKMEALRDPLENYNKTDLGSQNKNQASLKWSESVASLGIQKADTIIIGQPEFFKNLGSMIASVSIDDWKSYLKWRTVASYAPFLNEAFETENFKFFSQFLNGTKTQKPRWKRVVEQTNNALGELLGQIYVDEYLPKGTKEKLLEIGNDIRDVYGERLKKLDWMSEATKQRALKKLGTIVMKVGYPDKWKDMSALNISRDSWVMNVMKANQWEYNYMIAKFGKPVDRTEWSMYPQTYNAYYNPSNNEIVVPACNIIVPGFEGRMPDDAILYGIIGGSTFGHEITHGFDDQGSQYDELGNLNDWWTAEDRKKFLEKTKLIVEQFDNYVIDSLHINGDATQGENIADLGGVVMGYEAFQKKAQYKNKEMIAGLNPDQRYFLAYAYAWMVNRRPKAIQRQIKTDVHSPAQYRVNGPVSNMKEFYAAFGIKEGDPMWRPEDKRVVIW